MSLNVGNLFRPNDHYLMNHHPKSLVASLCGALVGLSASAALIPVSVRDPGAAAGITGSASSSAGVFAGANRIFFLSSASDLVTNDVNGRVLDLYWRDLPAGPTALVSVTREGVSGPGRVEDFTVSANGRRVAFTWSTDESALGDTNGVSDVYWRDLDTGLTQLVSRTRTGTGAGNGPSFFAEISDDGQFVVFESDATDLAEGTVAPGDRHVYFQDLRTGTTQWISRPASGGLGEPPESGRHSWDSQMNADGSTVVFQSDDLSLAPLDGIATTLLIWNRNSGDMKRVRLPGNPDLLPTGPLEVTGPVLSAQGRVLAFSVFPGSSVSTNLPGVWRLDLDSGDPQRVSLELPVSIDSLFQGPSLSADGQTLAFSVETMGSSGFGPTNQVRIWKSGSGLHTMESLLQTVPPTNGEPASSLNPILSPDGTQLIFLSDAAIPDAGVPLDGAFQWFHRVLNTGVTRRISADPDSIGPAFSPDATQVIVEEQIPVQIPGDLNDETDVVVVSLADGARTVVSLAGISYSTATGASLTGVGFSDDGRVLGMVSSAVDLVTDPDDPLRGRDFFTFDRITRRNRLVSVGSDGVATGGAREGVLSQDGRFMAYIPPAADGIPGSNLFRVNLQTGAHELVSATDGTTNSLEGWTTEPRISADGRWIGFRWSRFSSFGLSETLLYLRDSDSRRTLRINDSTVTGPSRPQGERFQISADARVMLFKIQRTDWLLVGRNNEAITLLQRFTAVDAWLGADGRTVLIQRDARSGPEGLSLRRLPSESETLLLSPPRSVIADLQISADGSAICYARREDPTQGGPWQVWVMPTATGVEELVSRSATGVPGSRDSRGPQISADGRFIAYRSDSPELLPSGKGEWSQILVKDRYAGTTTILSADPDGIPGELPSIRPLISGDGHWVAFTTFAENLLNDDRNQSSDVAMAEVPWLAAPDTDADGLADGWERDRFGSLDATAGADPDGDGWTTAQEQAARTNPTNAHSAWHLEVRSSGGGRSLEWSGSAGVHYQVEHSPVLGAEAQWESVGDPLVGYTGAMRAPLPESGVPGFYRLTLR